MAQRKIHGVIGQNRTHNLPGRIVNIRSKKNVSNNKIRLDKLLRSTRPRILIKRRLGGIGDVLMSTPLLKHIKRILPNCELTYATDLEYSWGALGIIIEHNPYVDILLPNGRYKESEYDYSVDITATGLNREKAGYIPPNRIDMFADEVGIDVSSDPIPDYILRPEERKWGEQEVLKYIPEGEKREDYKLIAIQCRSNDPRRTWPLEHVDKLADLLAMNKNYRIFLMDWGKSVTKWEDREQVITIKDQPFKETAAFIDQCDLLICPDSALLHLAGALNKKTVTIFGPVPPESRINYYPNAIAVTLGLPCQFCWYSKCKLGKDRQLECLKNLQPETVVDAVKKHLEAPIMTLHNIKYGSELTSKGQDPIILVKRNVGGLGDILMTGPALEALKLKYPDKDIHLAIPKEYHPVMENLPFIKKILDINDPINYKRYYSILDISNPCARYENARVSSNKKVEKSRVEIFSEALGVRDMLAGYVPKYNVTKEEKQWADTFLKSQRLDKKKKTIALQLKSAEEYRDYPEAKYNNLFSILAKDYNLILLGANRDGFYPNVIDACSFPIRKWAAVMSLCDGLISVDTGPLHVGAALNIPTIALFGPIDYKVRCKGYKNTIVIQSNLECIPCWRNKNTECKETKSIKGISKCMNIPPKAIYQLAKQKF